MRSDLTDEVRKYDQIVKTNASAKKLCGRGICCFLWNLNEIRSGEQQLVLHCWVPTFLKSGDERRTRIKERSR